MRPRGRRPIPPSKQKKIMHLASEYLDGSDRARWTLAEIAAKTGVSERTVNRVLLDEALKEGD